MYLFLFEKVKVLVYLDYDGFFFGCYVIVMVVEGVKKEL